MSYTVSIISSHPAYQNWRIQTSDEQIRDAGFLGELRDTIIPDFAKAAGVNLNGLSENGFRFIVDVLPGEHSAIINLLAGDDAPNPNPQDWTTARPTSWDPTQPVPFFEMSAEAAKAKLQTMKFGNRIFNVDGEDKVFGVVDGDPKADTHFLMLTRHPYATMVAEGFTDDLWLRYFMGAYGILKTLGVENQQYRFVANFGMGFQMSPRVHMHVLSSPQGLPGTFPEEYGFTVGSGGIILAPAGSAVHRMIIELIEERRRMTGFAPEKVSKRKELDNEIADLLKSI